MNVRSAALPRRTALAAAVVVGILSVIAAARLAPLRAAEARLLDWQLRAAARPTDGTHRVLVVGLDPASMDQLPRWGPGAVERSAYAPVIDRLAEAGAAAIALDTFFAPVDAPGSSELAAAIRRAGNVVVVAGAEAKLVRGGEVVRFTPPAKPIAEAAARVASPLLFRPDNVVRWVKLWQTASGAPQRYPALALAAVQVAGLEARAARSTARNTMAIHWSGPAGTVKRLRFIDVYRGDFDREAVRGRVVFVGRLGDEEDLLQTPVGPMHGVEIHAQAAATIIADCAPRMAGYGASLAVAIVLAAMVGLAVRRRGTWQAWPIAAAAGLAWLGVCTALAVRAGVFIPGVGPALACVLCGVVVSARQAEATVRALAKLWPSWVGGGMEEIQATVLVCDLAGYTSHAEQSSPVEVMRLLHEFFALVEEVVGRHGGVLARRPGDAAIVLFRHEDDPADAAARALAAAEELRDRLASEVVGAGGLRGFGITLVTGPVSVGFVGRSSPEPQVLGDPVNVAFRLQAESRRLGEPILLDGATAQVLSGRVALRPLGSARVLHRRQPVELFAPASDGEGPPDPAPKP